MGCDPLWIRHSEDRHREDPAPLFALVSLLTAIAHSQTSQPPLCKADQLRLITDDKDGNFDGMSHSGTLVITFEQTRFATDPVYKSADILPSVTE